MPSLHLREAAHSSGAGGLSDRTWMVRIFLAYSDRMYAESMIFQPYSDLSN